MRSPIRNGSSRSETALGMAAASPAAMRSLEGSPKSSLSTSTYQAVPPLQRLCCKVFTCAARTGGHRRCYALKIASMLRLFQAGVIAALMQCIAILLATLLIFSYAHHRIENLQVPADDPTVLSLIPLLQLIYLLTAVGVAATTQRAVL